MTFEQQVADWAAVENEKMRKEVAELARRNEAFQKRRGVVHGATLSDVESPSDYSWAKEEAKLERAHEKATVEQ